MSIEALKHGCDFCNHPLYAGTKCKNCGREAAAPVQERNFCERCGKRLGDGHIHTCTPPEAQRQWVGLSDLDMDELENEYMKSAQTAHEFLRAIEAALRSKNT